MQIASENPRKSLLELLIGQSVAKGIDGTVGIAQEVGEHVEVAVDTTERF